ncbi:MAG: TetR/AcrR family transcriptional regulator C-terminal domain-containing protein [Microthrixaceae bacterium]
MSRSPRLTPERIVNAGIELVDEEGLGALSMRRLARRLGVEAMSLYHHVRSKEALLDLMVDRIFVGVEMNLDEERWQDQMTNAMYALREGLMAHPNLLPVVATRPVMSEETMGLVELALAALVDVGFTLERSRQILTVLVSFAVGHALTEAGASPMIFDGYDQETVSKFRHSISEEELPLVAGSIGTTPDDRLSEFQLGVKCLVQGISAELDQLPA